MRWDILKDSIYEKWKAHWYKINPPDVAEYSWNYLFTGGKQIRPKLFCELWAYLCPDNKINTELAFAIECIHVASLILDDTPWMDNANERRNKKTLHTILSPKKAVLISYELMEIVRRIWTTNKPPNVPNNIWENLLITKLQRLVIGQYYDIEKKGNLIELSSLKTGVLFELITETVALCIDLDTEFWKIWGNNVGILFQWVDDWNDRQEDTIQGNRNAFNEDYDLTLKNYTYIWNNIEKGIGNQWFTLPFGIFMKQYFTDNIPILSNDITNNNLLMNTINIKYITDLNIPTNIHYDFKKNGLPDILNGKDIVSILFKLLKQSFTIPSIKVNLWNIDEKIWEHNEEIKQLIEKYVINT
jgi:geranylgeranyl pyrophosphate synthase